MDTGLRRAGCRGGRQGAEPCSAAALVRAWAPEPRVARRRAGCADRVRVTVICELAARLDRTDLATGRAGRGLPVTRWPGSPPGGRAEATSTSTTRRAAGWRGCWRPTRPRSRSGGSWPGRTRPRSRPRCPTCRARSTSRRSPSRARSYGRGCRRPGPAAPPVPGHRGHGRRDGRGGERRVAPASRAGGLPVTAATGAAGRGAVLAGIGPARAPWTGAAGSAGRRRSGREESGRRRPLARHARRVRARDPGWTQVQRHTWSREFRHRPRAGGLPGPGRRLRVPRRRRGHAGAVGGHRGDRGYVPIGDRQRRAERSRPAGAPTPS